MESSGGHRAPKCRSARAGTSCLPVLAGGGGDASGRAGQAVPVRVQVGRVHLAADVAFGDDGLPALPPTRVGRQGGRTRLTRRTRRARRPDGRAVELVAVRSCPGRPEWRRGEGYRVAVPVRPPHIGKVRLATPSPVSVWTLYQVGLAPLLRSWARAYRPVSERSPSRSLTGGSWLLVRVSGDTPEGSVTVK